MGAASGEEVWDEEERGVISEEKAQSQGQTGHLPMVEKTLPSHNKDSDLGRSRAISTTPISQWREGASFRDAHITKWAYCLILCPATPYPLDSNLVE